MTEPYRQDGPAPAWWTDPTENVISLVEASMKRQDDLRAQESLHIRELMQRDRDYAKELREIETARLDAIRAVDVGAVQRAAEVQATQAGALAAQVLATAEASRISLSAALEPIQKDIRDLRDAQSRGVGGKEQVTESRDSGAQARLNYGAVLGGVSMLLVLIFGVITVVISLHQ